jgi:integrase
LVFFANKPNPMSFCCDNRSLSRTRTGFHYSICNNPGFAILLALPQPERTITLLIAATGLRISGCLGLQWQDVDWANEKIYIRRAWTGGQVGKPKTEASEGVVPMRSLLADCMREWMQQTAYSQPAEKSSLRRCD